MCYPRVLIIGQSFNRSTGSGITLSNLFYNWPKDKIAIANSDLTMTQECCGMHYIIGNDETKKEWPFNLFQENIESGIRKNCGNIRETEILNNLDRRKHLFKKELKNIIKSILNYLGLFLVINKIYLSKKFLLFIKEFKPEIIYTHLASLELINFMLEIHKRTSIPIVVHIMDDWPKLLNRSGLLGVYWNYYTDLKFKVLLKKTTLNLAISDAMVEEYSRRYGTEWYAYHNIIQPDVDQNEFEIGVDNIIPPKNIFKIAYFGRIGVANQKSLLEFSEVINILSNTYDIFFNIYSPDGDKMNKNHYKNVTIKTTVEYKKVHSEMSQYNLLLLPLDFNKQSILFTKFSMPTKAIDYLYSGTPILIYAPKETAIVKFAKDNEIAYCITEKGKENLISGIKFLYNNRNYLKFLKARSEFVYKNNFNPERIREKFRKQLFSVIKKV